MSLALYQPEVSVCFGRQMGINMKRKKQLNNNMNGWRMKKYPGVQMAYISLIADAEFDSPEPISLSSMQ